MSKIVVIIYRFAFFLDKLKIPLLPTIIKILLRIIFSCQIGIGAKIGKRTYLGYGGLGVVIHPRVVIGDDTIIAQHVTIGGTSKNYDVPIINNCVIGANSVVTKDIFNNTMVGGIPAKILKRNIDISQYK